jgi:hypothetical protein
MSTIESGYRITVTSWENDADNYRTVIRGGFTKEQMTFLVELCNHLDSQSNGGKAREQFGNMYEPSERELEDFSRFMLRLCKKHGVDCDPEAEYEDKYDLYGAADEAMYSIVQLELYDLGLAGGEWCTRVCEKYTVEYVPVVIEIKDVTQEFQ